MIHIFRKEIRKWHAVLWVIVISFAISGASMMFFRSQNISKMKIASVDGFPITMKRYQRTLQDLQGRMREMQRYAHIFGLSADDLLKEYFGKSNINEIAMESCVKESLIDSIKDTLDVRIGSELFKEEFVKTLPRELIDERGRINMNSYEAFLRGRAVSPSEFEDLKEEEFKRELINKFVAASYYLPEYKVESEQAHYNATKSFNVLVFPYDHFLKKAKEAAPNDKELEKYFKKNKERYRVPEYRLSSYWQISAKDYAEKITVNEGALKKFYDKNKSSKYRIAPKLKVRHILIKEGDEALKKAQKLYEQVKEKPELFAELAKQHSEDKDTAVNGGLTKIFERGTFDADFEKAAFRLYKKGDLSDIVKTKEGYELIQLEERIKATYKPFDDVKEEILNVLKAKKALSRLKSDLEVMLHKMKNTPAALNDFVKANNLKEHKSKDLSKDVASQESLDGRLAKRLFAPYKRQKEYGYFFYDEKYVIYKHLETKKSFIKPLAENKEKVLKHYYKAQAKDLQQETSRKSREAFFGKKETLESLGKRHNLEFIQVENVVKKDKHSKLKDAGTLQDKMFDLTDKTQLLKYKHKKDYFLAQLTKHTPSDKQKSKETKKEIIQKEKMMNSRLYIGAFIEFLKKNAKIEVDEKMMKVYRR